MKIFVKAKPRAHENRVTQLVDNTYEVAVTAPPVDGLANKAIARLLADHFNVPPSQVKLVSGFSTRQKVFEV